MVLVSDSIEWTHGVATGYMENECEDSWGDWKQELCALGSRLPLICSHGRLLTMAALLLSADYAVGFVGWFSGGGGEIWNSQAGRLRYGWVTCSIGCFFYDKLLAYRA